MQKDKDDNNFFNSVNAVNDKDKDEPIDEPNADYEIKKETETDGIPEDQAIAREESETGPTSMAEIYAYRGETEKLWLLYKEDREEYDRQVRIPFGVDNGITTVAGETTLRGQIILKSPGCSNRASFCEKGSCANCGFCVFPENYSTGRSPVNADQYADQMNWALDQDKIQGAGILEIFNSGSFFDDQEVSLEARLKMFKIIADRTPKDQIITVEAKFADIIGQYNKVDEAVEALDGRRLEIAFGLETSDAAVGQKMNKSISQEQLRIVMNELVTRGVRPFMYILIKPDIMSDSMAVDSAVYTIQDVARAAKELNIPAEVMPHLSMSAVRVYKNSMLEAHSGYKATKLWAVSEVLKKLINQRIDESADKAFDHLTMHIGLSDEDLPLAKDGSPKNCGKCDDKVNQALYDFSATMNIDNFMNKIKEAEECPCHQQWEEQSIAAPVEYTSSIPEVKEQQLDLIMRCERRTWPKGTQASRDKFEQRVKIFSEGVIVAYEAGFPVGVTTSQIIDYDPSHPIKSWEHITNNGYINPEIDENGEKVGHNPTGNALYVVSVGVDPDFQKRGIGSTLVREQQDLVRRDNLKYLVLGARVPGLNTALETNPGLTPEEYINSTRGDNFPLNYELRFYTKNGLKIHEIVPNYMDDDAESANYGVVMVWENPDYVSSESDPEEDLTTLDSTNQKPIENEPSRYTKRRRPRPSV